MSDDQHSAKPSTPTRRRRSAPEEKTHSIPAQVLDELLRGYQGPKDMTGPDGPDPITQHARDPARPPQPAGAATPAQRSRPPP